MRATAAKRWLVGVALASAAFAAAAGLALAVLNEVANRSLAADVAAHWFFLSVFGSIAFLPSLAATLYGGLVLQHAPTLGRVFALIGLAVTTVLCGLFVHSAYSDAATDPAHLGEGRWLARLSMTGVAFFAVPFAVLALGNAYAALLLFRRAENAASTAKEAVRHDGL